MKQAHSHLLWSCILTVLLIPSIPALCLPSDIQIQQIAIAPALPCVREKVVVRAILRNVARESRNIRITARIVSQTQPARLYFAGSLHLNQSTNTQKKHIEIGLWQPKASGLYTLRVVATSGRRKTETSLDFAVTERKVHFGWYGYHPPRGLRYPTMHLTARKEEVEHLLFEGIIPLTYKGGFSYWDKKCHPNGSVEDQAKCWASLPEGMAGIAVDEWGYGEVEPKLTEVIRRFKSVNPHLTLALWNLPGEPYLSQVRDAVDIFMPEIYLNYHGMRLGELEAAVKHIVAQGLTRKTLIGLGIDRNPQKDYPLTTTPEELEAQMCLLKTTAPDILGVAFFYYGGAPPGLAQIADRLCYRYFVLPVVAIRSLDLRRAGQTMKASTTLENIGNMAAQKVSVEVLVDNRSVGKASLDRLPVGKREHISISLGKMPRGFHTVRLRVVGSKQITALKDREKVVALPKGRYTPLYLPSAGIGRAHIPVRFPLPKGHSLREVVEYSADGRILRRLDAQQDVLNNAVWLTDAPAKQMRFFGVKAVPGVTTPQTSEGVQGDFAFENRFYKVTVNVLTDAISELSPKPALMNLFRDAWHLRMKDRPTFRQAHLIKGPVFDELSVSLETDEATFLSCYTFYHASPVLELRREVIPQKPFMLDGHAEGAIFHQHGGWAQTFAGETSMRIDRAELKDTDDPSQGKDIYFGYLAASPAPDHCRKTGWLDFTWSKEYSAGLGVALLERWIDAHSTVYDVTRYYDASDSIDIFYDFRYPHEPAQVKISRRQNTHILLLPHGFVDLSRSEAIAPVQPFYITYRNPLHLCH